MALNGSKKMTSASLPSICACRSQFSPHASCASDSGTSPTSFVVEQTVQTKESARQMAWDDKTNRILLIAADYAPAPAPPAGKAAGRGPMVADSFSILVVTK
jgi:hypothetical protein